MQVTYWGGPLDGQVREVDSRPSFRIEVPVCRFLRLDARTGTPTGEGDFLIDARRPLDSELAALGLEAQYGLALYELVPLPMPASGYSVPSPKVRNPMTGEPFRKVYRFLGEVFDK